MKWLFSMEWQPCILRTKNQTAGSSSSHKSALPMFWITMMNNSKLGTCRENIRHFRQNHKLKDHDLKCTAIPLHMLFINAVPAKSIIKLHIYKIYIIINYLHITQHKHVCKLHVILLLLILQNRYIHFFNKAVDCRMATCISDWFLFINLSSFYWYTVVNGAIPRKSIQSIDYYYEKK